LCEDSETILDIGANTGIYALVAKAVNPRSKVYAFEPQPMFFKLLQQNVSLNNFDIGCEEKAVSNQNAEITIEDYSGEVPSIKVKGTTLDAFIETKGIRKIDLIKIDVESFEPEVLEGFSTYLSRFKPTILLEILNVNVATKVYELVKDLGYLYFNIDEAGAIRQTDKIEKSDYLNYLLCSTEVAIKLGLTPKQF
jgi:FkbM family methyltransferase